MARGFERLAKCEQHADPRTDRRLGVPGGGGHFRVLLRRDRRGLHPRDADQRTDAHRRKFGKLSIQRNRLVELAEDFKRVGQRKARAGALGPDRPGAPVGIGGLLPLAQFFEGVPECEHRFERAGILACDEAQVFERALEIAGLDIHQGQEIWRCQHLRIAGPDVLVELRRLVESALTMQFGRTLEELLQGFRIQRRLAPVSEHATSIFPVIFARPG